MKKIIALSSFVLLASGLASPVLAQPCTKIQSGLLVDSAGNTLTTGFDQWGYNYQAHMFNGLYDNYTRPPIPATTGDVTLEMKWSDDWLSNTDCNGDSKLDRGGADGANANISKGWLTNHEEGEYLGADNEMHHFEYFVKIVYDGGVACNANSPSCLWGLYSVVQEVNNDPYGGFHGVNRSTLVNPGLGRWK